MPTTTTRLRVIYIKNVHFLPYLIEMNNNSGVYSTIKLCYKRKYPMKEEFLTQWEEFLNKEKGEKVDTNTRTYILGLGRFKGVMYTFRTF